MGKKWTALAAAFALALSLTGAASADELLLDEGDAVSALEMQTEAWEESAAEATGEIEILEAEEVLPIPEEAGAQGTLPAAEGMDTEGAAPDASSGGSGGGQQLSGETEVFILDTVEVDSQDYSASAEYEIYTDVAEGQLSPSGSVGDAGGSGTRSYAASKYVDSYGGQLSTKAKDIYDQLKKRYYTKRKAGTITITFASPYKFTLTGTKKPTGLDLTQNKAYQAAYAEVAYDMQSAYDAFIYDYPEVFWISSYYFRVSITYVSSGGSLTGKITQAELTPIELYPGASDEIADFDAGVQETVAAIRSSLSGTSRGEIMEAIHDTICTNLAYEENLYAHSAVGVFVKNRHVVCEGYAKAVKILCRQFKIPCALIVGEVGGGGHMWNYVKMEDGKWYLLDTTWDDVEQSVDGLLYETYLLAGSNTLGLYGQLVGEGRTIYTKFSMTDKTQSFTAPVLSKTAYKAETGLQDHIWRKDGKRSASCTKAALNTYRCDNCKRVKKVVSLRRSHSYSSYTANGDATVLKDGTKTAVCKKCGSKKTVADAGSKLTPTAKLNATVVTLKKKQYTTGLKVTGLAKGDSVTGWKSSDTSIVKVSKTGRLTAGSKTGTAKVTVTMKSGLTKTVKVKVQSGTVKTTSVTVAKASITLKVKATKQLSPVVKPFTSGEKVTYVSSKPSVASVSSKGLVKAKKAGTAKITVKSGSKKAVVTVKVK